MTIEVFVRDVPLPPIPLDLVPHLSRVMQTAGHQIRWDPTQRTMMIDSPLDGYLIRCMVASPQSRMAGLIATGLVSWVQLAGAAVVQGADRRSDVTVVVRAEPLPQGGTPSILLASRPRRWFSRRESLATLAAAKLRDALRLPVSITHGWSAGKNELHVSVAAPENERLAQMLSKAIWQGLMAHFGTGGDVVVDAALLAALLPDQEGTSGSAPSQTPSPPLQRTRPAAPAPTAQPPQATRAPAPQPAASPAPPPIARPSLQPETTPSPPQQQPGPMAPGAEAQELERPKPAKAPRVIWASEGPDPTQTTPTPPVGFPQSAPVLTAPVYVQMSAPSYQAVPGVASPLPAQPPPPAEMTPAEMTPAENPNAVRPANLSAGPVPVPASPQTFSFQKTTWLNTPYRGTRH